MHGLINRSVQNFVTDTYGADTWAVVAERAALETPDFEAMLTYDDAITPMVLNAVAKTLDRPRNDVMEDIGTYLASRVEALRRLLRFGGVNFEEFLHSLDDLPDRARLAVADLALPEIELREHARGQFSLICESPLAGYGYVLMGVLRVMADDYGALALLDHSGAQSGTEIISISLVEAEFTEGRRFDLGAIAR